MREWEEKAKSHIERAKKVVEENPNQFPLGWEDLALDNLQQEMREEGLFSQQHLDDSRIDMAKQIIDNVKDEKC